MLLVASRACANLAVGKKLILGFGMVLGLTLTVAITGLYAVNAIIQKHTRAVLLTQVNTQILQTRQAEKDFVLTRNAESVREVNARLDKATLQIKNLDVAGPPDPNLKKMTDAVVIYRQQFQDYVEQVAKAQTARNVISEDANDARRQFEVIEQDMYNAARDEQLAKDILRGGDPLSLAESASKLSKYMLDLRSNESLYIIDGTQEALDTWGQVNDELQAQARNLSVWLGEEQMHALNGALEALFRYQQTFENYHQTRLDSKAIEARLIERAQTVTALSEEALVTEEQTMRTDSQQVFVLLGAMTAFAIALGICATVIISRLIVTPLLQTVAFAQKVAAGDLRQNLKVERTDELGQLLTAMQDMMLSLRNLIGKIGTGVGQIANASEALSSITAQTREGVLIQKTETEHAASAIQQMSLTVQEVAINAENASRAAYEADEEARHGDRVVREAVAQIDHLSTGIEHSAQAVQQLHQESAQINTVLEVIRSVAEQTNLLALNAAIEAARAGDQGRGFAVVADEVRALARRTQSSTQEIETLITTLQRMAQQAVVEMESSRKLTQSTVNLAGQASSALGRITQSVSIIKQMNQQIAASGEEQTAAAKSISTSMVQVRDIGEKSASTSEKTAISSARLAILGGELQGLLKQFQI
ncbi:methyl-accepting chemotaxis protein [Pseudomonas sp. PDM28]|nr:methyl-accepting chemotaxis protein [Pseudomonas sp. PDM28]MBV7551440.1 methyl-accepting chemotaxis protein [Pseudomonas sp. PDM28]